jgi:hypothetical protein
LPPASSCIYRTAVRRHRPCNRARQNHGVRAWCNAHRRSPRRRGPHNHSRHDSKYPIQVSAALIANCRRVYHASSLRATVGKVSVAACGTAFSSPLCAHPMALSRWAVTPAKLSESPMGHYPAGRGSCPIGRRSASFRMTPVSPCAPSPAITAASSLVSAFLRDYRCPYRAGKRVNLSN